MSWNRHSVVSLKGSEYRSVDISSLCYVSFVGLPWKEHAVERFVLIPDNALYPLPRGERGEGSRAEQSPRASRLGSIYARRSEV